MKQGIPRLFLTSVIALIIFGVGAVAGYYFDPTSPDGFRLRRAVRYEHFDALYGEFGYFPRPRESILVGFTACHPDNCKDWTLRSIYSVDQTPEQICDFYEAEAEARGWTIINDTECDQPIAVRYHISANLPIGDDGVAVRVYIKPVATPMDILPEYFYSEARRLKEQIFSVRLDILCGQTACQ